MERERFDFLVTLHTRSESDCLVWTGTRKAGYGSYGGQYVHRLMWERHNGPIPQGKVVRHSCDNPPCCNIDHLLLGTHGDNMSDRDERGRNGWSSRTHCKNNHEFTPENTRYFPSQPNKRVCVACYTDNYLSAYQRRKATT